MVRCAAVKAVFAVMFYSFSQVEIKAHRCAVQPPFNTLSMTAMVERIRSAGVWESK